MTCVICKGEDIELREVEEEIRNGADVFRTRLEARVCLSCGERYYDAATVRQIEQLRRNLKEGKLELKAVGRALEEA